MCSRLPFVNEMWMAALAITLLKEAQQTVINKTVNSLKPSDSDDFYDEEYIIEEKKSGRAPKEIIHLIAVNKNRLKLIRPLVITDQNENVYIYETVEDIINDLGAIIRTRQLSLSRWKDHKNRKKK